MIVDVRDGVKIIVQTEPLLDPGLVDDSDVSESGDFVPGLEVERVYPPMSRSPSAHTQQARRILSVICNVKNPEALQISDLTPRPEFLVSKAVERVIAAAIYSRGVTTFALMVERWLDNSVDPKAPPDAPPRTVYPGPRWMPLHLISFGATFVRASFQSFLCFFF